MLVPVKPGVWKSDQWTEGKPGLFAMLIGVSAYDNLDGSKGAYRLKGLEVSAITAFRTFRWLESEYRFEGVPIAMVWMLLSPTQKELQFEPALAKNALPPAIENCHKSIWQWSQQMKRLSEVAASKSRSIFFFSGHGIEWAEGDQILLPSDYLDPENGSINNAVGTTNLSRGLKSLPVPLHFMFVDACRNDVDGLEMRAMRGRPILDELPNSRINKKARLSLFYATAAGEQAFQPRDPSTGGTLFGQALLEGLRGQGPAPTNCNTETCFIDLNYLEPFVRERIAAIMQDRKPGVPPQSVCVWAQSASVPITEVQRRQPGLEAAAAWNQTKQLAKNPFIKTWDRREGNVRPDKREAVFGSAFMAAVWERTMIYDLKHRTWHKWAQCIELESLSHNETGRRLHAAFRLIDPNLGTFCWLEIADESRKFGCVLPNIAQTPPLFQLELTIDRSAPEAPAISRMEVNLSAESTDLLSKTAVAWNEYRSSSASSAIKGVRSLLALIWPRKDPWWPMAAPILGLIALRTDDSKLIRELGEGEIHPGIPDLLLLRSEASLRSAMAGDEAAEAKAVNDLLDMRNRPTPLLGESLSYMARQLRSLERDRNLPVATRAVLEQLNARVELLLPWYRPSGLFATFAGPCDLFPSPKEFRQSGEVIALNTPSIGGRSRLL